MEIRSRIITLNEPIMCVSPLLAITPYTALIPQPTWAYGLRNPNTADSAYMYTVEIAVTIPWLHYSSSTAREWLRVYFICMGSMWCILECTHFINVDLSLIIAGIVMIL